ncbi:hypothetical protein C7T94_14490 [Pedobacter yulinensis]|uniref:Uncharacterized protein n=1 Tax=Pedobacter yulinensis TaxID=2126353 RepID=A0A2T3HMQ8_9SPHI|nr:hypothetical protein [Pedobacter yulinensis]PST83724.1 hypothetical protein C7T94_14490 [Pedobacter yulinensis]
METNLNIVNAHLHRATVSLIDPTDHHYLLLAAEVDHAFFPVFLSSSPKKKKLISAAKEWCNQLVTEPGVASAVVFKARVIPPGRGKLLRERGLPSARYDLVLLIETETGSVLDKITNSSSYKDIANQIKGAGSKFYHTAATNVRRIGPVAHNRPGVFLFNYFFADDRAQNIDVWAYTAGWFQKETGLDNSTVLLPLGTNREYRLINHCRWERIRDILPDLLFKKTFRSFVLENFYANNVAPMPVLYVLA